MVLLIAMFPDHLFLKLYCPIFNLQTLNEFIIRYSSLEQKIEIESHLVVEKLYIKYTYMHIRTSKGKRVLKEVQKGCLTVHSFKTSTKRLISYDSMSVFTRALQSVVSY